MSKRNDDDKTTDWEVILGVIWIVYAVIGIYYLHYHTCN